MYTLLKLDYAKFGVSNLFFQKLLKKNLEGGPVGWTPLVKEGLIIIIAQEHGKSSCSNNRLYFFFARNFSLHLNFSLLLNCMLEFPCFSDIQICI